MIRYDMTWYDMIWCDMIWYDMTWYDMIWCDMIWYDMIWYDMIWYDMILCNTIWCHDTSYVDMIWWHDRRKTALFEIGSPRGRWKRPSTRGGYGPWDASRQRWTGLGSSTSRNARPTASERIYRRVTGKMFAAASERSRLIILSIASSPSTEVNSTY